jgi:hypothetical protein
MDGGIEEERETEGERERGRREKNAREGDLGKRQKEETAGAES